MKIKNSYFLLLLFGFVLSLLFFLLQVLEYKYIIGKFSTDFYTAIISTLFTSIGILIGNALLHKKNVKIPLSGIDHHKIKQLELKPREYEILALISKGMSNKEIADKLYLALPTIKTHTSNLYVKLDVKSRTQAIIKAKSLQLIQ